MQDKSKKFIVTDSTDTADLLLRSNFRLIGRNGKLWTFLNEPHKITFEYLGNAIYTDKLTF